MTKAKKEEKNKNIVDKKLPVYSFDQEVEIDDVKKTFRIELKRPTRSMYSDAEMFYSVQINKYIKMGLLTIEQLAKRQIDVGGTFSDEQAKHYGKLQSLIFEKEEMLTRLTAKNDKTQDEIERRDNLSTDVAILRMQITEYEYIRNQVYDHTANSKARNDVILWWLLNITTFGEIHDDNENVEMNPMFVGDNYETKRLYLEELQDDEDPVVLSVFGKLAKIITLWYWMGISDGKEIKAILKEEEKTLKEEEKALKQEEKALKQKENA